MRSHALTRAFSLAAVAIGVACGPAHAGTVATQNACLYSFSAEYRNQQVTLSGVGSPAGATAGAIATLSGASLSAQLPPSLPEQGYELGIFTAGYNAVPSKVWVAIAAANAAPATRVQQLTVEASTTIVVDSGGNFVSGTPIVVTIPIPDTTWTVTGAGPVSFSQAGPGTLPGLPVGVDDKVVPVSGSIVVKPQLANLRFVLDCQPGSTAPPYQAMTPAIASPFAALEAAAPVPPVPPPPPPPPLPPPPIAAKQLPRVASTKLTRLGGRVGVAISCPAGLAACKGRVSVRSQAPVRIGAKRERIAIAARKTYDVPAGKQRTVRLSLTPAARRLLRSRARLGVRVTLDPSSGADVTRTLTLHR